MGDYFNEWKGEMPLFIPKMATSEVFSQAEKCDKAQVHLLAIILHVNISLNCDFVRVLFTTWVAYFFDNAIMGKNSLI